MSRRYRRNRHQKKPPKREVKKTAQASVVRGAQTSRVVQNIHQTAYSWCRHWEEEVELLYGLKVWASAWADRTGRLYGSLRTRGMFDYGIYFDDLWSGNSVLMTPGMKDTGFPVDEDEMPKIMVPWADRQAPSDVDTTEKMVYWMLDRMRVGDKIEVGCFAAHGRTGTMLACLLVGQGMAALEAVKRVREGYCVEAVESQSQINFVYEIARRAGQQVPSVPVYRTSTVSHLKDEDGFCVKCLSSECIPEPYDTAFVSQPDERNYKETMGDEDYEEWLRLNTSELVRQLKTEGWDKGQLEAVARKQIDRMEDKELECVMPPCPFPHECNIAEGECWKAQMCRETSVEGVKMWDNDDYWKE